LNPQTATLPNKYAQSPGLKPFLSIFPARKSRKHRQQKKLASTLFLGDPRQGHPSTSLSNKYAQSQGLKREKL
jgi:hypothetical protein